ncbi:MAG: UDP-N-acetylglucosamine 2-epimerase (non-hydrolyzing) [Desulfomicrobium sp.]|nr:UDP-N-acetylglucosamine 2-epimerase (non-hydrolyzing) [Pseudomonadota bacterium]MBV1711368.1 UDP-N-acetylglucosamine 2-epimerase (non-hydrolyzing) [Desulfomicrobium sp.]MBU4570770.1 UDP-N-acetylglucosamine 2-epimerase (non-hydrolyzing) [Pseudomonadota bacterium]MBU4595259.1 UDP-N-acetylglucosamine 2-epimerase (non-hydrolyzing) [Pseudomonadota bacterium]MBV1720692.1 UDP-N-acetylglucosamine 2-epimerase (non-hydrolyzing) [Desulfomicrobium sp.]
MKIISVVGARPNFMKIAPFVKALEVHNTNHPDKPVRHILVHTGQHYDMRMSEGFFRSLSIPDPDINLEIGSGSHAEQVGQTMIAFEKVLLQENPDWVVVVGDVNATLACSVTAKKLCVKVCHIEAGLRSGDITMPEEINRLVTDRLSDLLLTPDRLSSENLRREGVPDEKVGFVGNIMIDTLEANRDKAANLDSAAILRENLLMPRVGCPALEGGYAVVTMHRPSNVDRQEVLEPILNFLTDEVAVQMPVIWPIHPRTRKMLQTFGLWSKAVTCSNVVLLHPIGYHEMLRLNMQATIMLTDSGGLQEECCVLGTPCLTLRWNTERPVTLKENGGASVLVGNNVERIRNEFLIALQIGRVPQRPDLWDGKAAVRCVEELLKR